MSENCELLYAGFDTLYVTIQGALDQAQLDKLQTTRTEAQQTQSAQPIYIGPGQFDAQVHPSGQRGGYAYRLEAGPTDLVWSIKHSADPRQWNLFAAAGSACLLSHGLEGVKAKIWRDLKAMGARWADHSINRIDFAMDFRTTGLELDYRQLVAHPHTSVRNYIAAANDNDSNIAFSSRGHRTESITVGKMPGRQIIIYDKRREAIQRQKHYWFKVWGIKPDDRSADIYRVEFRAGKKHLKDKWQLSTFEDIENSIGDVFMMSAEKIRYLDSAQSNSNVSRQSTHPFWIAVQSNLITAIDPHRCGLFPNEIRYYKRNEATDLYRKLLIANALSLAIAMKYDLESAIKNLPEIAQDTLKSHLLDNKESFIEQFSRVCLKMRFTEN